MDEGKVKTAEQKAEEKTADKLLEMIIGKTYAEHSNLTEEEYLKSIGFEGAGEGKEADCNRIATFNVLVAMTKEIIATRQKVQMITGLLQALLVDESIVENKGEN